MRRLILTAALALGLAAASGCSKPPPSSLTRALTAADAAVRSSTGVRQACEALAKELGDWEASGQVSPFSRGDVRALAGEVAALGAAASKAPVNPNDWNHLKAKLEHTLGTGGSGALAAAGGTPVPDELQRGLALGRRAVEANDGPALERANRGLLAATSRWAATLPEPDKTRLRKVVEREAALLAIPGAGAQTQQDVFGDLEAAIREGR